MTQLDLFAPALPDALAARDEALAQVAQNAEDACPGFAERAREHVLLVLSLGVPASAEDLTDSCLAVGIVPHDLRAMGPVLMGLSREGLIEKCGTCLRRRGHGTAGGNRWRLREGV